MRLLIIGGTRFFGKRFARLMLEAGHDVTLLTRGQAQDELNGAVRRLKADRTDESQLRKAITRDYDVVVDNILMTATQAEAAKRIFQGRIGHYVMTSTLSVYELGAALTESAWRAEDYVPGEASNPYQEGKRAAEHALLAAPFSVARMRIPIVVGPDDYTRRLRLHVETTQKGSPLHLPVPSARFSYLHAQDAARALEWLCAGLTGAYNVSAPDAWPLHKLVSVISGMVGKPFIYGDENASASPFGITGDYFMDVSHAANHGFTVAPLEQWLPELIAEISAS